MCLFPQLIKNRRYTKTKKNGGKIPPIFDKRVLYVPIGCGKCMECMKQKARNWQVRLQEDIKYFENPKFVTYSFSDDSLIHLEKELIKKGMNLDGYELENEIATIAVRRFLERWRKKYKKSLRHWLITELGSKNTERIHIHGIIYTDQVNELVNKWGYGHSYIGDYVNDKTINYISKYINKRDLLHKEYNPKLLVSAGIGGNYTESIEARRNKFRGEETDEAYVTRDGIKLPLPIYYRNKIYSDEEREKLWIMKLDKQERYIDGIKFDVSKGEDEFMRYLKVARDKNKELGYGDNTKNWNRIRYEKQLRELKRQERWKKKYKQANARQGA